MELISISSSPARPAVSAAGVKEPPQTGRPDGPRKPDMDKYVPEEKQQPSGRYWPGRDEEGSPRIYFDDPGKEEGAPGPAEEPEKSGKEEKRCSCSTDKADREIERLKKQKKELERQIRAESDGARLKDLKGQLAQVERELRQKDSGAYRRQHAQFTQLS